jgi:hypothetical protein
MKASVQIAVCVGLAAVTTLRAEGDPLSGRWRLATTKSTATAPMPKAETQVFEISGGSEHGVTEITSPDGTVRKTEYTAQSDGKWYPVNDAVANRATGSTVMIAKLDEWTSFYFSKRAAGNPYMALRTVAKDGKTFVWTSIGVDGKVTGTYVFEKE